MTENRDAKIGGLLLAAGGSSRLGRPKQFVQFHGTTLLRRAAEALAESECEPVVAVIGAEIEQSKSEVAGLIVKICVNKDWELGMSSSIRAGLTDLLNLEPELDAVMITLCDQPFVTTDKIDLFAAEYYRSGAAVVTAEYDGTTGVPALFSSELFDALLQLKGDKGARDIIRNRKNAVRIRLDAAGLDIDEQDDIEKNFVER